MYARSVNVRTPIAWRTVSEIGRTITLTSGPRGRERLVLQKQEHQPWSRRVARSRA
jgi:hypothetical protein